MTKAFFASLLLAVCFSSQALAEILHADSPGLTLYVRVRTGATTSVAAALTEGTTAGEGFYRVADSTLLSAGLNFAGTFAFKVFQGAPSTTVNDTLRGTGTIAWSGAEEIPPHATTERSPYAENAVQVVTNTRTINLLTAVPNNESIRGWLIMFKDNDGDSGSGWSVRRVVGYTASTKTVTYSAPADFTVEALDRVRLIADNPEGN